jgi:hypothetical protein
MDILTNYTLVIKDNKELGARGSKVKKNIIIISYTNLLI